VTDRRVPCSACGALIIEGAKKCRACKAWIGPKPAPKPQPAAPRIAIVLGSALATLMVVLVSGRESKVGDAPPLTNLTPDSSATVGAAAPAAIGPEPSAKKPQLALDPSRTWRVRQFPTGGVRPLDLAFNPKGSSVYVSCDDATLREYKLSNGELLHQASVPAQGDQMLHPVQQRKGRAFLRLDVDRFIPVDRVHDDGEVEPPRIRAREAGVAVAAPLHRGADAVAVTEIDVVAHPDLVAVVDDRRSRQ